jgi:hypothetical protein
VEGDAWLLSVHALDNNVRARATKARRAGPPRRRSPSPAARRRRRTRQPFE